MEIVKIWKAIPENGLPLFKDIVMQGPAAEH